MTEYMLADTNGVAGFLGASSTAPLATETTIAENLRRFKAIGSTGSERAS